MARRILAGVALLLCAGCAASYMMGYTSARRTVCVRWAVQGKGVPAAELECVETTPVDDPVPEAP